jgi:hypothetical protein
MAQEDVLRKQHGNRRFRHQNNAWTISIIAPFTQSINRLTAKKLSFFHYKLSLKVGGQAERRVAWSFHGH